MHARTLIDEPVHCKQSCDDTGIPELPSLFDALAAQDWPVLMLERTLPELLRQAQSLAPADRCAWLAGLHQVWWRHGWALTSAGKGALLELAATWCAWPLAYAVGQSLQACSPLDGEQALLMIDACRQLGDGDTAIEHAVRLQLLHPTDRSCADVHFELQAWLHWRDRMPVVDGIEWGDDELRLEPLAHHHMRDFAWQYYDPAIAELCCTPNFQDEEEWHRWLDELYRAGDQRIFAVIHHEWGFVGCVSLIMYESVGFFYYWLGRDFQGYGLGPRAVSLMLAMAQHDYGMRCCYAKVFDHNTPSRRALQKLGFEYLGICGVAPDDNQLFYRWGAAQPADDVIRELHVLLDRMDSDTKAAALCISEDF